MNKFDLDTIFTLNNYDDDKKSLFNSFNVVDVLYKKNADSLIIKIENEKILPIDVIVDLKNYFDSIGFKNTRLYFKVNDDELSVKEINSYIAYFKDNFNSFKDAVVLKNDNGFVLSYLDENSYEKDKEAIDDLKLFFYDLGYHKEINMEIKELKEETIEVRKPLEVKESAPVINPKNNYSNNNAPKFNNYKRKTVEYKEVIIDDLEEVAYNIKLTAQIFKIDERKTKTGLTIQTIYLKDTNNACVAKMMEGKRFNKEDLGKNKEGKWVIAYGNYLFNTFSNDYELSIEAIEYIDDPYPLKDDEEEKRVELHAHSKLSEMDGVSSPTDLVNAAYKYGHRAVALTDHLDLQGYHEAYLTYKGIKKGADKDKPFDFKLLYGCEMNMVYPNLNIVYNSTDDILAEQEYVVFDLETTGLCNRYDRVIEFGAVLMYKGQVKEYKDFFVKVPFKLSEFTKNLTNISDGDIESGRPFEECKDEILDFIKGRVLVAHNASFDYNFLNAELARIGLPKLTNPVIDTLDLSRSLFKTRRAYRLGNMARQYGVEYNEEVAHRANYDAEVLAQIFNLMLKDLGKHGVVTLNDLKNYQGDLRDIIAEAKRQNKIIVATGDVHYVKPEEKILRDVYISAQAIGGAHHPLYVFDKEKRAKQVTPDQHFRNTREMLDCFSWLEDEKLIHELVIENPNKIADMCEDITPFSDELRPPRVLDAIKKAKECRIFEEPFLDTDEVINADDYLRRLVYYEQERLYGKDCDEFIKERTDRELNAIIGNGYGVIYYTCHLMVKRSNNDGYIVGSRGSVGSSLVATLSGITEVNPLPPHYVCPKCHHFEWIQDAVSGFDAPDKVCPKCGEVMKGNGQNIPFETFMGFNGDKVPDIDLNFSGDYQPKAHLFTREIFGKDNVFRAGTISTVADKTAYGYVTGYCEEKGITNMSRAQKDRLAAGCTGVKRTTGQHAGGIVVLPDTMEIEDVTPIQYPANDKEAPWRSTHFEYHDYSDNILKFDILGHVDPTVMRLYENISGIDVKTIPMNDEKVLSLFSSSKALNIINPNYHEETGACGLPEFGTLNTRNTIEETRPKVFSDLVQISGLSHGTDVWSGNAQELIRQGIPLSEVIGCRDDIMVYLQNKGLDPSESFTIMERVRKGAVANHKCKEWDEYKQHMLDHDVPAWYIGSCEKIQYMFPKAHAVAYCIMAVRVAWFKVYHPEYYYVAYFTLRCDAYELETMVKDADSIYARMKEIQAKMNSRDNPASKKERDIFNTIEVCYEMVSRGYKMTNIDLYKSYATEFRVNPDNDHEIIPPFTVIDGLGGNVAESVVEARENGAFLSKEDLSDRTQLSNTLIKKLSDLHVLDGLDESNQVSLF